MRHGGERPRSPRPPRAGAPPAAAKKPKSKKNLLIGLVRCCSSAGPGARCSSLISAPRRVKARAGFLGTLTTTLSDGHLVQATIQLQLTVAETAKVRPRTPSC